MILELFDYQFIIICYKSDAKLQKNIQTTKYQFFTQNKKAHTCISTLCATMKKKIFKPNYYTYSYLTQIL